MNPSLFTMCIGIPGSGKSFYLNKSDTYIVCPDDIRRGLGDVTDQSKNELVWAIAQAKCNTAIELGNNVTLDATNVNTPLRRDFLSKLLPCKKIALIFEINPDVAYQRIEKDLRSGRDRSNVPKRIVYRMYGEFLYTKKVIHTEFDTIHHISQPATYQSLDK